MRIISLVIALAIIFMLMNGYLQGTKKALDTVSGRAPGDTAAAESPGPAGHIDATKENVEAINKAAGQQAREAMELIEKQ